MKKALRVALVVLALAGSVATTVLADGPGPQPTCDPTTSTCTQ